MCVCVCIYTPRTFSLWAIKMIDNTFRIYFISRFNIQQGIVEFFFEILSLFFCCYLCFMGTISEPKSTLLEKLSDTNFLLLKQLVESVIKAYHPRRKVVNH